MDDHLIRLGKCLAAEAKAGYIDAVAGGMATFLQRWRADANGTGDDPTVKAVLERLERYPTLSPDERRERIDQSLVELRALVRAQTKAAAAHTPEVGAPAAYAPQPTAPKPAPQPTPPKPAPAKSTPVQSLALTEPLANVNGIGPTNARAFARLGLRTVEDMLYHFPHRYDDYSKRDTVADLTVGTTATIIAEIVEIKTFSVRTGAQGIKILLNDGTGVLQVSFFGQQWLAKQLFAGQWIVVSGKVSGYMGQFQISSPKWEPYREDELIHAGRLVPVHPLTKGLYERNVRTLIKRIVEGATPNVPDHLPDEVRERAKLLPLNEALRQAHFPDSTDLRDRARYRLGFDEFLFIQLGVLQRKKLLQGEVGNALPFDDEVHERFLAALPFKLTAAQERALGAIFGDLKQPIPMARLVQGDVGSGKTVVAAAALVQAIANGFQGAIMAPTEILAEQHYRGLKKLLGQVEVPRPAAELERQDWQGRVDSEQLERMAEIKRLLGMTEEDDRGGAGIRVALLTGSLKTRERRRVLEAIAQGQVDLVVGTHALISESVQYNSLGLVVVDEQHRFGVEQRERLKQKGHAPDLLVMTATPIPRTLALSIYGDLDSSVIDERPPGRQPIKTRWIRKAEVTKAHKHIRKEIAAGRQAFVICPLVEESEKIELASAVETQEELQTEVFPELQVGLIHGRMSQLEKDQVMADFRDKAFDILVATAVVEVGIDIPNATTILILGAERFGLAQLHQFRGRVGRGEHQSFCIVVSDVDNEQTQQRLEALEATEDGFKLADVDLELRGPGEFFGRRQSGTPDLKMAKMGDLRLLEVARLEAERILQSDPQLERTEHDLLRVKTAQFWEDTLKAS